MFTRAELIDAINEIEDGKHSIQNCERLAAIYTVLDHLYEDVPINNDSFREGYSMDNNVESEIGLYGKSEFLNIIAGKSSKEVWLLIDELIEALNVLNPRLSSNFLDKLRAL